MTTIDTVGYSVGLKEEMTGSGVFSGLVLKNNLKDRVVGLTLTSVLAAVLLLTADSKGYISLGL